MLLPITHLKYITINKCMGGQGLEQPGGGNKQVVKGTGTAAARVMTRAAARGAARATISAVANAVGSSGGGGLSGSGTMLSNRRRGRSLLGKVKINDDKIVNQY